MSILDDSSHRWFVRYFQGDPALCHHGRQVRDFLHVADVAAAFVALLESEVEGPVNVGSGVAVTQRQVVETIAGITRRPEADTLGRAAAAGRGSGRVSC